MRIRGAIFPALPEPIIHQVQLLLLEAGHLLFILLLLSQPLQRPQGSGQAVSTVPTILILRHPADQMQGLQHIDDVIDAPPLHTCLQKEKAEDITQVDISVYPLLKGLERCCELSDGCYGLATACLLDTVAGYLSPAFLTGWWTWHKFFVSLP